MSRSMPVTAGTPSNDLTSCSSRIAPPFILAARSRSDRHRGDPGNVVGEPGEVGREPIDIVAVVLNRKQPLLHLPPWREKHPAIVLPKPVQVAESGVDVKEVAEFAHRLAAERHAPLGACSDDVPAESVFGDGGV